MGTTYTPSNIGTVSKDWVRFMVGDVDGTPRWFLQDEEIVALLGSVAFPDGSINSNEVCAQCAQKIGAMCIQLAQSVTQADLKQTYGDRATLAFSMRDDFRNNAMPAPGSPREQGAIAGPMYEGRDGLPRGYDRLAGIDLCPTHNSPFDYPPY